MHTPIVIKSYGPFRIDHSSNRGVIKHPLVKYAAHGRPQAIVVDHGRSQLNVVVQLTPEAYIESLRRHGGRKDHLFHCISVENQIRIFANYNLIQNVYLPKCQRRIGRLHLAFPFHTKLGTERQPRSKTLQIRHDHSTRLPLHIERMQSSSKRIPDQITMHNVVGDQQISCRFKLLHCFQSQPRIRLVLHGRVDGHGARVEIQPQLGRLQDVLPFHRTEESTESDTRRNRMAEHPVEQQNRILGIMVLEGEMSALQPNRCYISAFPMDLGKTAGVQQKRCSRSAIEIAWKFGRRVCRKRTILHFYCVVFR